jgi:hypothetical protein
MIVQMDNVFQTNYQAILILNGLGAKPNPGWPVYPNQTSFVTGSNLASILCAVTEISYQALRQCWYWKWQVYRKVRPECSSLWIDNIKNNRVKNKKNYDISSTVLDNPVLNAVQQYNADWGVNFQNSYTLTQTYQVGSPSHPSYPAAHAVIAGACATILKIYYDTEQPWTSLSGVQPGSLNRTVVPEPLTGPVIIANDTGLNLVDYVGEDISQMTIAGEINKLASNVAIGRMWAGVHYRSDTVQGMLLGEAIAIKYMEDILSSNVENNLNGSYPQIKFRKFTGEMFTVIPTIH